MAVGTTDTHNPLLVREGTTDMIHWYNEAARWCVAFGSALIGIVGVTGLIISTIELIKKRFKK
jgi:hypothetical protein